MPRCIGASGSGPRGTQPGVGAGFCRRPVSRRATLSSLDRTGYIYARESRHRSGAEVARGTRGRYAESDSAEARSSKAYLLRQRIGVHQSDHGSLGVSRPGADRLLTSGKARLTTRAWSRSTARCERSVWDVHWFATLTEAKQVIEDWRQEYNESRPHRSLGERTPSEFACQIALNGDLPSSQTVGNSP